MIDQVAEWIGELLTAVFMVGAFVAFSVVVVRLYLARLRFMPRFGATEEQKREGRPAGSTSDAPE